MRAKPTNAIFSPECGHKRLELRRKQSVMDTSKEAFATVMAMPDLPSGDRDLLREIARRCTENLRANVAAQDYLKTNGLTAENIWRRYRLGIGDDNLPAEFGRENLARLGLYARNHKNLLVGSGVRIPTYDPREPEQPSGLLVVREALNRALFATAASGVGCPQELAAPAKVVLCDAPLNALRLAQMGCGNVLIVIDPDKTLPPLHDWLATREVVAVSTQAKGLAALRAALGSLSERVRFVQLPWAVEHASAETLAELGIGRIMHAPKPQHPMPTQTQLAELVRYAQQRLASGEGGDMLKAFGAADAELVCTFALGFIPGNYRTALPPEAAAVWRHYDLHNTLIAPALDEEGVPADFMVLGENKVCGSLFAEPRGLVASKIATAFPEIHITESLKIAIKLFRSGQKNILVLRSPADARQNVARLVKAGVKRAVLAVRHGADEIARVLADGGIDIDWGKLPPAVRTEKSTNPETVAVGEQIVANENTTRNDQSETRLKSQEPAVIAVVNPAAIVLISFDPRTEQAIFKAGDATYTIDASFDGHTRMAVRLERVAQVHVDRFDLASDAQRRRFATSAAIKVKLPFEQIEMHLVAILEELQRLQQQLLNPTTPDRPVIQISEQDRAEALATLKRPDLLDHIASDLDALGWAGENEAKRLLYLTAISRKLPNPLSAVRIAASGAGKSYGLELLAELAPPEDLIHVSRLTDSALYYQNRDGLRHKLLLIDEACALTPEALTALRILQTRGALSHSYVLRDPNGGTATHFAEAKGPVAVLTSSIGGLDEQNLSRCFSVAVDESPAQTRRVLEVQRRLRVDPKHQDGRGAIIRRQQVVQRLLECRPVVIPFADRIEFPATSVKHRREQERFLNLIEASALLHQHQRLRDGEFIVADRRDFELASRLAADSIARSGDELTPAARDVLMLIVTAKLATFTMDDLKALKPDWTRYRFRYGLDELVRLEIVTTPQRGRGALRSYTVRPGAAAMLGTGGVRLSTGLAQLAAVGENATANLSAKAVGA